MDVAGMGTGTLAGPQILTVPLRLTPAADPLTIFLENIV